MRPRVAPQSGHVSNFCGLKRGPLEPLQLPSGQWLARKAGTTVQTASPARARLELAKPDGVARLLQHASILKVRRPSAKYVILDIGDRWPT